MEQIKQVSISMLTDREVLFFSKIVEVDMTLEERQNPQSYVDKINYLAKPKCTKIDQIMCVIPTFILQMEEEDARLKYKNMGIL
jgi:hypothetical protein